MLDALNRTFLLAALVGSLPVLALGAGTQPFSHGDWAQVLQKFVNEDGLVDYQGLAADREVFDRYLEAVQTVGPEHQPDLFPSRDHELAYYINGYNALIFEGVLDKGPDSGSVWGLLKTGKGFFVDRKVEIGGKTTNLKKLEDEKIREGFKDPRVHAALNCASLGCPRLPQEPFEAQRLDEQLDAAMKEFVHATQGCQVDAESKTVKLSKIFEWFEGDFLAYEKEQGNETPVVLDYVNRYRGKDEQIPGNYKVEILDYDKGLNSQK